MQAHSTDLWKEPAQNGATPQVLGVRFVSDGPDWIFETSGDEGAALFLIGSDYVLVNIAPVGGDYYDTGGTLQTIDPAVDPRLRAVSVGGAVLFY